MKIKIAIVFIAVCLFHFGTKAQDAGTTPDSFDVSLTGAATYDVPIAVPPGIRGVEPKLSLSFNSQAGNGLAGYGWNIGGLSTITRMGSTKYHDDQIDPVDFDSKDRFALDGQRLLLKAGIYGTDGAVYQTENYSNIKIRSTGVSPYGSEYGPEYFVIHYPDGSRGFYGNTIDSKGKLEWALNRWEDTQGNFIRFTYSKSGELLRIANIYYGSRGTTTSPNHVSFVYDNRSRIEQSYIGGQSFARTKILAAIEIFAGGQLYRKYDLTHDPNSMGYDRVVKIQESNGIGGSMPAIDFNYNDWADLINRSTIGTNIPDFQIDSLNTRSITGDFSGDSHSDLIFYNRQNPYSINVYNDLQTGTVGADGGQEITTGRIDYLFPRKALDENNRLMPKQNITIVSDSYSSGIYSNVTFRTYSMDVNNGLTLQSTKVWDALAPLAETGCDASFRAKTLKRFISGDFNGDAITDVIALTYPYVETNCNPGSCDDPINPQALAQNAVGDPDCCECTDISRTISNSYFIDLDRRKPAENNNYTGQLKRGISYEDKIFSADFNGDQIAELIHISPGRVEVYSLGNGSLSLIYSLEDNAIDRTKPILPGDYNGDGKMDFAVAIQANSSQWRFFMSTGVTFASNTMDIGLVYEPTIYNSFGSIEYNYINQDFNGDGKTDILRHSVKVLSEIFIDRYEQKFMLYSSSNANNGFPTFEQTIDESFTDGNTRQLGIPLLMKSDYTNRNLEYGYLSGSKIRTFEFTKDLNEDVKLNSIVNNGLQIDIDYGRVFLSDNNTSGANLDIEETYPYVKQNSIYGLDVVYYAERRASGYIQKRDFRFEGAVSHTEGLGFLGFQRLYRTNWYGDGVTQLWSAIKNNPQLRGTPVQEWSANFFSRTPYNYISKTDYAYNTDILSNQVFVNVPNTITSEDAISGFTTTQSYIYDTNYETTRITSSSPGGSVINEFMYFNSAESYDQNYHIGRPKNKKTTSAIGSNTFYEEEEYTYENNLMETVKRKGQGTDWVTETFTHDVFGNTLTKTLSTPGMTSRTERYTYDSSGRYFESSKNIEQLKTTFTYDVRTGSLLSITDPYNMTTSYTYDGWNRQITETDYLGKISTTTYSVAFQGGFEQLTLTEGGGGIKQTYNAFGWQYRTQSLSLNGKWITTVTRYDTAGRVVEVTEPFFSTENEGRSTDTIYDEYGRPISITSHTGEVQNITYNGLSVTVDDGTKSTTTTSDSLGNVLDMTDPGGTVNYTYHGNGIMKTANYGGQVVETAIDAWGRKIRLIDPSSGTYTYTYNLYGEITADSTPKGNTFYTVNGLGKLTQKTVQGDETNIVLNYSYGGADKLLSQVTASDIISGRTYTYAYSYDSFKRPNELIETNPFARFEVRSTFDEFGRPLRETYNSQNLTDGTVSNITVRNQYDAESGMLEEIRDDANNQSLWRINAHDARGQVTRTVLGNGYDQNRDYDTFGFPDLVNDIKIDGAVQQNALRMDYNFNAQRGILDDRSNVDLNWSESFAYDQLDRLTTISGSVEKTQSYDNRGRIGNNTAIGDYSYGNDKIYRIAGLDLNEKGSEYYSGRARREITYNAFKKPTEISEENKGRVSFGYSPLRTRSHAWYGGPEEEKEERRYRKHYSSISPVEIVEDRQTGETKIMTYLGGDQYSATIVHIETKNNSVDGYHYLHRDYLGSILAITDSNANVVERTQFGAWGKVDMYLSNDVETEFSNESLLGRGYTGHEHFFSVGLIHMNGRMYDPQLGSFLSPDNYIQNPYNSQNFNRYGYVFNNPLIYSDPSGEMTEPGEGISDGLIGAIVNSSITAIRSINWDSVGSWFNSAVDTHRNGLKSIGQAFKSLFSKNRQASAVMVSSNRANIVPNIRSMPNVPPLFTGGGGGGFSDAWNNFKEFQMGGISGHIAYASSTWRFVKSLTTSQGWANMGQGFLNLAKMGDMYSWEGRLMSAQIGMAVENFIDRVPEMSYFELGHYGAYTVDQIVGGILVTRGTSLAVNGLRSARFMGGAAKTSTAALRNGHLAGKLHPVTKVPFTKSGFPNFSKHLYRGGKNDVFIKSTGTRAGDFAAANKAAGYSSTPKGFTWHHHQTTGRMQLINSSIHGKTGHTGGFLLWNL